MDAPRRVSTGQAVGFGVVEHMGRGWYLITSDGRGVYGAERSRGGRGCDCAIRTPRQLRAADGRLMPVEYEIAGEIPPGYTLVR